jgi:hypothetical protein
MISFPNLLKEEVCKAIRGKGNTQWLACFAPDQVGMGDKFKDKCVEVIDLLDANFRAWPLSSRR